MNSKKLLYNTCTLSSTTISSQPFPLKAFYVNDYEDKLNPWKETFLAKIVTRRGEYLHILMVIHIYIYIYQNSCRSSMVLQCEELLHHSHPGNSNYLIVKSQALLFRFPELGIFGLGIRLSPGRFARPRVTVGRGHAGTPWAPRERHEMNSLD